MAKVMTIDISYETLERINFDNFNHDNLPDVADHYSEHAALKQ